VHGIEGFVSLFSVENTAPYKTNYKFYEWLFTSHPQMQMGLTAGFYYSDKKQYNPITEAGDIMSFQTTEAMEDVVSPVFHEYRLTLPVPSKLFGPNVYEVWKFFHRKK
jgi:hypothetical protein